MADKDQLRRQVKRIKALGTRADERADVVMWLEKRSSDAHAIGHQCLDLINEIIREIRNGDHAS